MTLRQRQPRIECPAFLAFVRRHKCCACGAPPPSQAAHLRMSDARYPDKVCGVGMKPSDRWVTPLCADCHLDAPDAQHKVGEPEFWKRVGINPFDLAANLYAQFERRRNRSAAERDAIVARAKRMKRRQVKKAVATKQPQQKQKSQYKWPTGRKIPSRPIRRKSQ